MAHKYHVFWADEISQVDSAHIPADLLLRHRQITDAYLLGLVMSSSSKLATLDKKITWLLSSNSSFLEALEIVPLIQ